MNDIIKHKKMDEIVIAISSHSTLKDAATSLDCDVRTLQRYMEMEDFPAMFYEFNRLTQKAAAITLSAHQLKAMQTITSLLDSPLDSIRLQAANTLVKLRGPMINDELVSDQLQLIKTLVQKAEAKDGV